jgi:hypothetical protein
VENRDHFAGVFRIHFFGAAIAPISCHRRLNAHPGAHGVGRADAFVLSFIAILDFMIETCWTNTDNALHPQAAGFDDGQRRNRRPPSCSGARRDKSA